MAQSFKGLATLYVEQGQYAEAELLFQRALSIQEQTRGKQHVETADTLHDLAACQQAQGKCQQAAPLYQRALAIREQVLGAEHPKTTDTRERLCAALTALERKEEMFKQENA
ncbi:MAG TPA: tetratricopeptide repeat protein [Ktedonobacteraceae bacterium]|nr:tetratricopeptide repeat protein [Ktedonobacteraceae bacterium]